MNSSNPINIILIIFTVWILYKFFWLNNININSINSIIETIFGYSTPNKETEHFAPFKQNNITDTLSNIKYHTKVNNDGDRENVKMDNIFGENGMDTSLYQKDTIYDKLVDIFTTKEDQYQNCAKSDPMPNVRNTELEDWERDIKMTFKLVSVPNMIFNRESIPVTRHFQKTDEDNTLLPLAQSAVDILNEKSNKTSIITDIKDIEVLTTEDQKQYTFYLFLNYPTVNDYNVPVFKNIKVKVVLVRRRLLKDDIFAPNRYDTTKFVVKSMELLNYTNVDTIPQIKKGENDYYSFKKLMTETGEFTDDKYIDKEMIRNRIKHEHEMDFRNIIIEDDNYLNDYMNPNKLC